MILSRGVSGRARRVLLTVSLATMLACQETTFVRTNPFDLEADLTLGIAGIPDTIYARDETFVPVLVSDKALPRTVLRNVRWALTGPILLKRETGRYHVSENATSLPKEASITATIGVSPVTRTFVVMQRITGVRLRCASNATCDTLRTLRQLQRYDFIPHDASMYPVGDISRVFAASATLLRDRFIVEYEGTPTGAGRLDIRAVANGATWLVVDYEGLRDSIRIVVHQQLRRWAVVCPATVAVGETVQLGYTDPRDGAGFPLQVPTSGPRWVPGRNDSGDGGLATVTPEGLMTGVAPGVWYTSSYTPDLPTEAQGDCLVEIVP